MFKSPKDYILVALVLAIILLIAFWPSKPIDTNGYVKEYESKIQSLERQDAIKDAQISAVVKVSEDTIKYFQAIVGAKDKEIKVQKVRNAELRKPIQPLIDSVPALKAYIEGQDSLLAATEQRADVLQRAYTSQIELNRELKTLIVDKDRIANEMFVACSQQLDKADRLANKEHKRKTFFKKLAGVLGIIVITETLLLVAP